MFFDLLFMGEKVMLKKKRLFWIILFVIFLSSTVSAINSVNYQINDEYLGNGKFVQTSSLGYTNYFDGNEFLPIDSSVVISFDPLFDYEVTKGVYQSYFKEDPTEGQVIKFVNGSEYITYQPMALNYRNDLSQLQQISMVQSVTGVPSDNSFLYENAYGEDIDLQYSYWTDFLREELIIISSVALVSPAQYIVDGGNPTLDLDFVLTTNSGRMVIDGVEWDKSQEVETSNPVFIKDEFGNVIYYLKKPYVYDSNGSIQSLTYNFRKSGQSLFVTVKTPYSWISSPSRVYPIYIDPDTGVTSPGTMADDDTIGTSPWTDPDNAKISDDSDARALISTNVQLSHYLKATNFGFSIPVGATIDGIVVEIERQQLGAGAVTPQDNEVKIVKADASIGDENKASANEWPLSDAIASYGAIDDLWSESWSAANINDSNFGVVLSIWDPDRSGGGPTVMDVDHIRITVYYTIALLINIVNIDGFADDSPLPAFSYVRDGNLTIDLNVSSIDSNSILLDLNFSTGNIQGAGTVIIDDLNLSTLTTTGAYNCTDTNFNDSTQCSIDFNINSALVADGNYFIIASIINSDGLVGFNASDNNFMVDNTIPTITVYEPIDGNLTVTTRTINFDVNDNTAGISQSSIRIDINGTASSAFNPNICTETDGNFNCSYPETGFATGADYNLTIFVDDLASNSADQNELQIRFTGDNSAPTIIVVFIDDSNVSLGLPFYSFERDGNITIDFNVLDADADNQSLTADIYYGTSILAFTTRIIDDLALTSSICDDGNFTNSTSCSWDWDISSVADGNYFINVRVDDSIDTGLDNSDENFLIDNTSPTTTSDANSGTWQNTDANVHLTCSDVMSGCKITQYRRDIDSTNAITFDEWQAFDSVETLSNADSNSRAGFIAFNGDFNSITTDTSNKIEGTASLKVDVDVSLHASNGGIFFINFPQSLDLNALGLQDANFSVWLWFPPDFSNITNVWIELESDIDGFGGFNGYIGGYLTWNGGTLSSGWKQYSSSLNDLNQLDTSGLFDYSDANAMSLSVEYTALQDDFNFFVDDIRLETNNFVLFNSDGNWAIDFNSSDNVGNIEDTNRQYVLIDKTAPTTTSNINSGVAQPDDANVVLTCVDPTSGCSLTQYRLDSDSSDNVSFGAWTTFTTGIEITIDGNYAVDFNSSDVAGNLETTNTQYVIIAHTQSEPPSTGGGLGDPPQPPPEEIPSFVILEPEGDFTLFYVLTFPIHQKFKLQNLTNRELTINMSNDLPNSAYHTIYSDWDGILDANSTKEFYISFLFNRSINTNKIQIIFSDNTPGETLVLTSLGFFTPADELPGTVLVSALEFLKIDFLRSLLNFDLGDGFVLGWVLMSLLAVLFFSSLYMASGKTRVILLLVFFVLFVLLLINFFVFPMEA